MHHIVYNDVLLCSELPNKGYLPYPSLYDSCLLYTSDSLKTELNKLQEQYDDPIETELATVSYTHLDVYKRQGYYKYKAGEVYKDENGNIVKDKKDTWDIYAIFYETDEKTKTLDATNRFDHPNLISIARIDEKDRKETDEWTEFYLPFVTKTGKTVDKDKLKAGKYNVAIVFSSSIEGDYFRGAVGSTLHIDEVELIHAAD